MLGAIDGLVRYLRRRLPGEAEGDDALFAHYADGDESAFAALVARHAGLVFGACRRVLADEQSAEDAFQAVFLVLAAKAGSLGGPLAPWLHRVAWRTAAKARLRDRRRLVREKRAAVPESRAEPEGLSLDEEIDRLPDRYRLPVLLVHVEGLSGEEAARALGCAPGTIHSRLSRARDRLRAALGRQGLATLAPPVPSRLVEAAVSHAGPPLSAAVLAKGVLSAMLIDRLKFAALVVAVLALGGFGAVWFGPAPRAALSQEKGKAPPPKDEDKKPPEKKDERPALAPKTASEIRKRLDAEITLHVDDPAMTLGEILDMLANKHGVRFTINERAFQGGENFDIYAARVADKRPLPRLETSLHEALKLVLSRVDSLSPATFLIRERSIEITTEKDAIGKLGIEPDVLDPLDDDRADGSRRLPPLVWEEFAKVPLAKALLKLGESSGRTVVLDARVEKKADLAITARVANLPVESALRLIADMAELDVVRLDGAYYVTSAENAEKLKKRWAKRLEAIPMFKAPPARGF